MCAIMQLEYAIQSPLLTKNPYQDTSDQPLGNTAASDGQSFLPRSCALLEADISPAQDERFQDDVTKYIQTTLKDIIRTANDNESKKIWETIFLHRLLPCQITKPEIESLICQIQFEWVESEGAFSFYTQIPVPQRFLAHKQETSFGCESEIPGHRLVITYNQFRSMNPSSKDNTVLLFPYGDERFGQYWPAVVVAAFVHPVLFRLAKLHCCATKLWLRAMWFDNEIEIEHWTVRPLNANHGPCFQHSLLQHFLLHKHEVPSMPLMACHKYLSSIEAFDSALCACVSFPCLDNIPHTVAADRKHIDPKELDWRYIVPPEFTGVGCHEM